MVRILRSPPLDLSDLHRRMEQVLENLLHGADIVPSGSGFAPRVDARETSGGVQITVELPGVARDDIEVTVAGSYLHVAGVRREPATGTCVRWLQMEIAYGSFERVLRLPFEIDPDGIRATYEEGFLIIEVPRGAPLTRNVPIASP